jgi:hypothetical protein
MLEAALLFEFLDFEHAAGQVLLAGGDKTKWWDRTASFTFRRHDGCNGQGRWCRVHVRAACLDWSSAMEKSAF